jgi:P27 family predicted phage terminase small subunit
MPRGRKPRPTPLHHLHGTFNSTRHRDRLAEPVTPSDLAIEPPEDLSDAEKEAWRYCVDNAPRGVLRAIDRSVLRIWVETEERYRRARVAQAELNLKQPIPDVITTPNGSLQVSPYIAMMNRCSVIMLKVAELLGFVPVSRPRLAPQESSDAADDDRWNQLIRISRKPLNQS